MLIPWSTEREPERTPYLTCVLVAANIAVFLLLRGLGNDTMLRALHSLGFVPNRPELHALITSMFLHANILHLAGNMLFLWVFGRHVEDVLGIKLYALLYFSSGLAAIMLHTLMAFIFSPDALMIPAVGASGCIAGILGLFAIRFFRTRIRVFTFILLRPTSFTVASGVALGIWLASEVFGGLSSLTASGSVANWAHIGGFFYGIAMALMLRLESEAVGDHLAKTGAQALRIGDWHGAIERYAEVVGQDPTNVEAHTGLATAYSVLGEEERSIAHFEEAVHLLCKRAEPAQALLLYKELRGSFRDHVAPTRLRYQIACARETMGEVTEAYQELAEIRRTRPAPAEAPMALLKMAQITMNRLDRPADAFHLFYEFKTSYPDSIWAIAAEDGMREAQRALSGPEIVPGLATAYHEPTGRPARGRVASPG